MRMETTGLRDSMREIPGEENKEFVFRGKKSYKHDVKIVRQLDVLIHA
jgi:hypothetical protein